jgi:O-antigen/teichoic acid export membrane protein
MQYEREYKILNFNSRFYFTVTANILISFLNFVVSIVLARYFSVEDFGSYQYLLSIFTSVFMFLSLGANNAYYTFISQQNESIKFHINYVLWQLSHLVLVVTVILLVSDQIKEFIFDGIDSVTIVSAAVALFFFNSIKTTITHIAESARLTYSIQALSLFVVVSHLILVLYLSSINVLSTIWLFALVTVEYLIFSFLAILFFRGKRVFSRKIFSLKCEVRRFVEYSKPLLISMIIVFSYSILDKWFLQHYSGSDEQAYFGVSLRVSTIAIIVTTSVINIFWKEIAEAVKNNQMKKVGVIFHSVTDGLFLFTTMSSMLLFQFSDELLLTFYGEKYLPAALVFKVMMLYPITQSLGQMYSSFFLAVEKTKILSVIISLFSVLGIAVSMLLLTPFGSNMGSTGLAYKMIAIGLVTAVAFEYYICKLQGWENKILNRFAIVLIIYVYSYGSYVLSCGLSDNLLVQIVIVSWIYVLPVTLIVKKKLSYQGLLHSAH